MGAVVVRLRSRWATARADPRVRSGVFHLKGLAVAATFSWGMAKLCRLLPGEFEKPCHLAGWIVARVAYLMTGN